MSNKFWTGMTTAALATVVGTTVISFGSANQANASQSAARTAAVEQPSEAKTSQSTKVTELGRTQPQVGTANETANEENSITKMGSNLETTGEMKSQAKVLSSPNNSGKPAQAAVAGKPEIKPAAPSGVKQSRGVASWYGPGFHGRTTANGERYNQNGLTAAHRSLPFGTRVRVTNVNNGRSVVVRINDRGPFAKGRVIDLSAGAARVIGLINSGVAPVRIEVLGR